MQPDRPLPFPSFPPPMSCVLQFPTPMPEQRRILVGSNDVRIPPLLEPVKRATISATSSQATFKLNSPTSAAKDDDWKISSLSMRRMNISSPLFQLRRPIGQLTFDEVCADPTIMVNPRRLGFIPSCAWSTENVSFGILVTTFFRKRNSMHSKFPYKLYNALKLSEMCPEFTEHLGIQWVTDIVFRVHRNNFARLIGVKTVEGGLFHQQGNFPSHGFIELPFEESDALSREYGFGPCSLSVVRFVQHANGIFTRFSTEASLEQCKWSGS